MARKPGSPHNDTRATLAARNVGVFTQPYAMCCTIDERNYSMITDLREALKHAAKVYGAPMVAKSHPDREECNAVYFGEIDVNGKHATEFVISGDGRIVYYRRQGMGVKLFNCGDFVHRHQSVTDRMAEYAEQFTVRKTAPKSLPIRAAKRKRRFSTAMREARCTAARIQAQRHAALNALYHEAAAMVLDNRALMAGAI